MIARLEPRLQRAIYDSVRSSSGAPSARQLFLEAAGVMVFNGWGHEGFLHEFGMLRIETVCSVYGVRKSFDLDVVPESERRGFCATVRELVTSWQGETRTAQVEFGGEWCHVIVSSVLGHDDWNLKVFVLFVPDHDNPPFVSVSLHLRRYRQLA